MFCLDYPAYFPPPKNDDSSEQLDRLLIEAVLGGDIKTVRSVYDTIFWRKAGIKASPFHVLAAVLRDDREILKILAQHGASWTAEMTQVCRQVFPQRWPDMELMLKRVNLFIQVDESVPMNAYTEALVKHTLCKPLWRKLLKEGERMSESEAKNALSLAVVSSLRRGQVKEAAVLLCLRAEGATHINLSREFCAALQLDAAQGTRRAFDHFDRLIGALPRKIALFRLDAETVLRRPEVISFLSTRKLLDWPQGCRSAVLNEWMRNPPATHSDLYPRQEAVRILFSRKIPLTRNETIHFANSYTQALDEKSPALEDMCRTLVEVGFFNHSTWMPEWIRMLEARTPENCSAKMAFNQKIFGERFGDMGPADLMSPRNLDAFLSAHQKGYYRANGRQGSNLLHYFASKWHQEDIPAKATKVVSVLHAHGVRFYPIFSAVHGREPYLGKKEPGLVKVLLDLGILKPEHISLSTLLKKADLPQKATQDQLYWRRDISPYAEFLCQVWLENRDRDKYLPLRGKISSYHRAFKDRIVEERGSPPSPLPPPKGGFLRGLFK